ncbi:hypothetical protein [Exiguobacterium sp. s36]|uniref:hypothetical protein n=1 Tax=Exiguobacterium sp. s36 TaxID=2751227 RepID=UPI001BEC4E6D|nr:hypothetical protein [Exiguobacterium sp. s36]
MYKWIKRIFMGIGILFTLLVVSIFLIEPFQHPLKTLQASVIGDKEYETEPKKTEEEIELESYQLKLVPVVDKYSSDLTAMSETYDGIHGSLDMFLNEDLNNALEAQVLSIEENHQEILNIFPPRSEEPFHSKLERASEKIAKGARDSFNGVRSFDIALIEQGFELMNQGNSVFIELSPQIQSNNNPFKNIYMDLNF